MIDTSHFKWRLSQHENGAKLWSYEGSIPIWVEPDGKYVLKDDWVVRVIRRSDGRAEIYWYDEHIHEGHSFGFVGTDHDVVIEEWKHSDEELLAYAQAVWRMGLQ